MSRNAVRAILSLRKDFDAVEDSASRYFHVGNQTLGSIPSPRRQLAWRSAFRLDPGGIKGRKRRKSFAEICAVTA